MNDAVVRSIPADTLEVARLVSPITEQMLGDGYSVIDPSIQIWTSPVAEELRSRIEDNPILGSEDLWTKFHRQLEGAPLPVILLAAEMVLLRGQPVINAKTSTRLSTIEGILRLAPHPVELPDHLRLDIENRPGAGFAPGRAYHPDLWKHVPWMAKFIIHYRNLNQAKQRAVREDPWQLQNVMLEVEPDQSDIRNALQFLMRPEVFEPIASNSKKEAIRDALIGRITPHGGNPKQALDKDLLAIRESLARERDEPFHYWSPGVEDLWNPVQKDSVEAAEPRGVHYWVFAPGEKASRWEEQYAEGIMALEWDELGDFAQYSSVEAVLTELRTSEPGSRPTNDANGVFDFQNHIQPGDVVYAKRGRRQIIGRGIVTSDARFEPQRSDFRNLRSVEWTHKGEWPLDDFLPTKTLTDYTSKSGFVEAMEATFDEEKETLRPEEELKPYTQENFLSEVFLTERDYTRLHSLLSRKKNVILSGPPGVGKTFAAKRLAYSIMGEIDASRVQTVQFHQSYSYEDFVMGYRPTGDGGFKLAQGPFYKFCDLAREDPERPYFLIIDEINRGNVSRIFGELLMLIEADKRGHKIRMLYNDEQFTVPPNLHIVGMMNTADRSLATMDYALRRRFGFFNMRPAFDSQQFQDYVDSQDSEGLSQLVRTLHELNAVIAQDEALGPGFEVGHSYVVDSATDTDQDWLESVVEDELVPLVEEYWFDSPAKITEWADRLRGALNG